MPRADGRRLRSEDLIPKDDVRIVEHNQRVERWKHVAAIILVAGGFATVCGTIVMPLEIFDAYRDKAWTLLTVILGGALGYLFGRPRDE